MGSFSWLRLCQRLPKGINNLTEQLTNLVGGGVLVPRWFRFDDQVDHRLLTHSLNCKILVDAPSVLGWIYCETSILAQAQETWMNLSQLNALFAEGKTHIPWAQNWGHKFEASSWATNLILWSHFWVQNLAPVLGPQNRNRSYPIRAARMLLPT